MIASLTSETWANSPAQKLTLGNYLPQNGRSGNDIRADDKSRLLADSTLELVDISGVEYGRSALDRRIPLQSAGERYGQVSLLHTAAELRSLTEQAEADHVDLDTASDEVKTAILSDIASIRSLNDKLFWPVEPERLESIVARARLAAEQGFTNPELSESAQRLLAVLPPARAELADKYIDLIPKEVADYWRPLLERKFSSLLENIPEQELDSSLDANGVVEVFRKSLTTLEDEWGLDNAQEWTVQTRKGNQINVDNENHIIWIGESMSPSGRTLRGLLVHEEMHLIRNLLGEKTEDPFMASDLPGRAAYEEALGVAFQQIINGSNEESGIIYYLGVGLANGVLGHEYQVPLADLQEVLLDWRSIMRGRPLTEKEGALDATRAERVTRGMPSITIDGDLHQSAYSADLKYAVGRQKAIADLVKNLNNPAFLDELMYGKYDYSNPEQLQYARAHKPSDAVLANIPVAA